MSRRANPELARLLGEEAFIRLAEAFGGLRLYVPVKMTPDHEIARAIGAEKAALLSERMAPDYIRVPLARDERASQYRAEGRSNQEIARALGISEAGVDKLFKRLHDAPAKGSRLPTNATADDGQLELRL